ncbi:CidA/LrgA family protein [Paenibacillus sp. HJL G12]|uniref:CidA/LrgA family protein n=1 Tax=Paenibacillus dendrobii TaxID=2691084 RepID=A0A7X3IM44_9BACL|nr:CidA/LrgA family protein [Paenibacillus dendrobii]MWV46048.1 CidA/LrgA family protein [Paenibacillus dendrobii]
MIGFAILAFFQLVGWLIQRLTGLPLPANVIGLLLFIAALFLKWVPLHKVEETASFLLKYMSLFFVPVIVGSLAFFPYLREHWFVITGSGVISLLLPLLVTGWLVQSRIQARNNRQQKENAHVHRS